MRIYPDADISFSVEKPSKWESYIKYGPNHSWKHPEQNIRPKNMYYWRDIEGFKKKVVESDDLYFKDWPKSRIRPQACLGMLYATGIRNVRLSKAPPVGFKCAPLPVNLEMAYKVNGMCNNYTKIVICILIKNLHEL